MEKRYLFKRAFRSLLPAEILAKRKHGFGIPTSDWLRRHRGFRDLAHDTLLSPWARGLGYFRPGALERLFALHASDSTPYYGDQLWTVLMLHLWHRRHLGGPRGMSATQRPSLVRLVAGGLHHSGLLSPLARAVGYARRAPAFPILTYHRVNDDGDPFFSALPSAVFERQMRHVARNYRVLPLRTSSSVCSAAGCRAIASRSPSTTDTATT